MTEHRYEADAVLAGACELVIDGGLLELITLTLTDGRPTTMPDDTDIRQPDVICTLRPSEARLLAHRLHELAGQLNTPTAS